MRGNAYWLLIVAAFSGGCVSPEISFDTMAVEAKGWGGNFIDKRGEHLADYVIDKHVKPLAADLAATVQKHATDRETRLPAEQAEVTPDGVNADGVIGEEAEEEQLLVVQVCRDNRCRVERIKRKDWPQFWADNGGATGTKFTFLAAAGRRFNPPFVVQTGMIKLVNQSVLVDLACTCPDCQCFRANPQAFVDQPVTSSTVILTPVYRRSILRRR